MNESSSISTVLSNKLKRVLKYLYGTKHMKLCLTADNLENITWLVDDSYAVHWDSRSHMGMVMSFGLGAVVVGDRNLIQEVPLRRNLSESTIPSSILCGDCISYKHNVSRSRRIFVCKIIN